MLVKTSTASERSEFRDIQGVLIVKSFQIMAKSRDWDELTWVWTEWRRKTGRPMRDLFEQLADLTNEAAKYNSEKRIEFKQFLLHFPQ